MEKIDQFPRHRIRRKGGGRKPKKIEEPKVVSVLKEVLRDHTAGSPMNEELIWTDLSISQIQTLIAAEGIHLCHSTVQNLLKEDGYKKRLLGKSLAIGQVDPEERNGQFENISKWKKIYFDQGLPVIRVDTKKKERLGNLFREGTLFTKEKVLVYDHDDPYLAQGVVIPHGIYDIRLNQGFVTIGNCAETAEFICDSIAKWWFWRGQYDYSPHSSQLLMLLDAGGANSSRSWLFKEELLKLSDKISIEIQIAHFPSYTSKWNPIEHLLFPHITRRLSGIVLKSYQTVKELIEKTTTKTGLVVKAYLNNNEYLTGKKYDKATKTNPRIVRGDYLDKWNYTIVPSG